MCFLGTIVAILHLVKSRFNSEYEEQSYSLTGVSLKERQTFQFGVTGRVIVLSCCVIVCIFCLAANGWLQLEYTTVTPVTAKKCVSAVGG